MVLHTHPRRASCSFTDGNVSHPRHKQSASPSQITNQKPTQQTHKTPFFASKPLSSAKSDGSVAPTAPQRSFSVVSGREVTRSRSPDLRSETEQAPRPQNDGGRRTERDGAEINRLDEVRQQRSLQAQHVPAQDLVAAGHGAEPLAALDPVPRGHDVARLHGDGAFPCGRE